MTIRIDMDKLVTILEEIACNPGDIDLYKTAEEIREMVRNEHAEDLEIADNMKSFWVESASGAERG